MQNKRLNCYSKKKAYQVRKFPHKVRSGEGNSQTALPLQNSFKIQQRGWYELRTSGPQVQSLATARDPPFSNCYSKDQIKALCVVALQGAAQIWSVLTYIAMMYCCDISGK